MYESILVLKWGIFEKTKAGIVPAYNISGEAIKTITGVSPDDCERKLREFLSENEFISLKENKSGPSNCNQSVKDQ